MQQYIDKTESLEKGIVAFPFIYIMGASAVGKSVAVQMLCEKHPEVYVHMVDMKHGLGEQMSESEMAELLGWAKLKMKQETFWLVFENAPKEAMIYGKLEEFVSDMPDTGRVILVGRENISDELLPLYWKRKLEIIPQAAFELSRQEIRELKEMWKSPLDADEVWKCTGGWAGCADILFRTSVGKHRLEMNEISVRVLMKRHEIVSYIQKYIIGELPSHEQNFLESVIKCIWVNEEICQTVLNFKDAQSLLESMYRRGFLQFDAKKMRWKAAALFENFVSHVEVDMKRLGEWYEQHGHTREALVCYEKSADENIYQECLMKYFHQIPFIDTILNKSEWAGKKPQHMYLRGMQKFYRHDFEGLQAEIKNISMCEMDEFLKMEMLLNLNYVHPEVSLDEWLELTEQSVRRCEGHKFRLYNLIGNSCTYLCGLRDLSGLFACTKKEENRRAKIWQSAFGEFEWKCYQFAKLDYYLETQRHENIDEDEWNLLQDEEVDAVAQIYLLGKTQHFLEDADYTEQFRSASEELLRHEDSTRLRIAEAVISIQAPWLNQTERLTTWLKRSEADSQIQVNEETYMILWCMAKGYLLLNQYKKAEKILKRLIPYLKLYRRGKLLAEVHLQQAIISWETGHRGLALQNMIESFQISSETRYVALYSNYGKRAKEVLEAYEDWHRTTFPESWRYKKKYPYGNVLRMPMSDYIEVIMRSIRREARTENPFRMRQEELIEEHLTMMETLILQEIGRGLTNSEICKEQNLKMPTVKSHIYSLYKKLGVSSRVQATIKGKELGILK